eukprot:NODE_1258_length_1406_cov_75.429242_g1247_i0.p1 GENE.NODE_1258_length_1406_cov_75.429242_g1247_i0~~NODE_1258_length_1406_cov_75.429242_g1247_i0.p1  ORF type:complete len:452 (+),score=100.41 NODE_1258_length_1406_cov_75.429242_g1247_i0:194-1357(+)
MTGPAYLRPPYEDCWFDWHSSGFGIFEWLDFVFAAGIQPVVSMHLVDDPGNFTEYVYGNSSTTWGRQRVADGHSADPYPSFLFAVSNEQPMDADYLAAFTEFTTQAMQKANALGVQHKMQFAITGDSGGSRHFNSTNPYSKQIVQYSGTLGVPVYWDQHVYGAQPYAPYSPINWGEYFMAMKEATTMWGFPIKVVVLEENGGTHDLSRALGHAANSIAFQNIGEQVVIQGQANCMQCAKPYPPVHWNQGTVFFNHGPTPPGNNSQTWLQPTAWATWMIRQTYMPNGVASHDTDNVVYTQAAMNDVYSALTLRVVNPTNQSVDTTVAWNKWTSVLGKATVTTLTGNLTEQNTQEFPERVAPVAVNVSIDPYGMALTLPAWSFTTVVAR